MARSLVTGGAGFVGSNLVDALLDRGDEVLVVDDLSTGRIENIKAALGSGAAISESSIVDRTAIDEAFASFRPDRVFHLAAQVSVRRAVTDPIGDATCNVLGTINLLGACRDHGVAAFVFASTGGAIYGEGDGRRLPLTEDAATAPETGYGVSKLAAESYVSLYSRLHGLPGVSLRFANVYGPRQDPDGEAGVVAIFSGLLFHGEPLGVVGDGLQTRDYVYVEDVVSALLGAGDALAADTSCDPGLRTPLNIGTGVETSVLALVDALGEAAGVEPSIRTLSTRPGEVRRIAIDPGAAAQTLGWRPLTSLADGLRRTYQALTGAGG